MPKKVPLRMCVACRAMRPKRELIRLVANKEGDIALDPTGKKPGRGAYVCRDRQCLGQAIRGRKLDKGLKTRISEALIARLTDEMETLPPMAREDDDKDGTGSKEEG